MTLLDDGNALLLGVLLRLRLELLQVFDDLLYAPDGLACVWRAGGGDGERAAAASTMSGCSHRAAYCRPLTRSCSTHKKQRERKRAACAAEEAQRVGVPSAAGANMEAPGPRNQL